MKHILLLLAVVCTMQTLAAQDLIITRESKRIDAKIVEVSDTEVRYKKQSNPNGPVFVMGTDKISSIVYANGEVQSFGAVESPKPRTAVTPNEILYRERNIIVSSKSLGYEPANLSIMLGSDAYDDYLSAQGMYGRGAATLTIGWICAATSVVLLTIAYIDENPYIAVAGYIVAVATDIMVPLGYIIRGVAAGRISRIAEHYNAGQNRHLSLDMAVSPTLLPMADGKVAPGVGFSLRF